MEGVFADGVKATLTRLEQNLAYAGLLEGYPCTRVNELFYIQPAREESNLVLPPDIKPLPGFENEEPRGNWGKAEKLPDVQVRAYFTSHLTRQPDMHKSTLIMTWWQDDYVLSMETELARILSTVNWWDSAKEWSIDDL